MSELPGPLAIRSAFPFVGRHDELMRLRSLMPWAEGEGRRVALVGGEPGSGKSRLVREYAAEAAGPRGRGARADPAGRRGGRGPAGAGDPDPGRHRLHTAVADLLAAAGA